MMKPYLLLIGCLTCATSASAAALPTFYAGLHIQDIESMPNATDSIDSYSVTLTEPMQGTGCQHANSFLIESGNYKKDALSILLAAMMADKPIRVRVSRCLGNDRPVVDRVAVVNQ